jgi:hypothetical protein
MCDHGDVWHSLRDTPSDNCLSFHQVCSQGQDCDQTYQILKQDYTKMATTFRHYHTLSPTFVIPITPPITPQHQAKKGYIQETGFSGT